MTNLLAIDPSTKSGYALLIEGSKNPVFGTWKLGEDMRAGAYFLALCNSIAALRKRYGIEDQPLQIIVEDKSLNAIGNAWSKHLAESWIGVIETWCETRGLDAPVAVSVNSWRSAFIGRSMAPKEITGSEARRKWIKQAVIDECRRRGLHPANDNEGDVLGILFWYVNGGRQVQELRRSNKVARTKAKRAQKRFLFERAA